MIQIKRMLEVGSLGKDLLGDPPKNDWDLVERLETGVAKYGITDVDQAIGRIVFEGEDGKYYRIYCVVQAEEVEPEEVKEWLNENQWLEELND